MDMGKEPDMNVYEFKAKNINGGETRLSQYRGKVLLIVNVASRCGFTPQYEGLEKLQQKFQARGFVVLGFPCNQFAGQETGTDEEIKSFCEMNYQVTFPLFSKIDVNGGETHPLYRFLVTAKPGILGTEAIKWNFTKFLIDRQGNPVKRYASAHKPEAIELDILEELAKPN
jgi:glutathione peroxidase